MGGGTVALENREWNLQCVDARLLPHPQLSSFRCRHRRPAGDEVVRLLPDASLLEPRDRTLPECTLPIRAMVSAGRHRGLGALPGWSFAPTRPAVWLVRSSWAHCWPADSPTCGRGPAIDDLISLNPASLELEGGVPLKTRPLWIGCPAQADPCVLTACTGRRTPRVRRNITPPGAELLVTTWQALTSVWDPSTLVTDESDQANSAGGDDGCLCHVCVRLL